MKPNIGDKEARYYCPVCRTTITRHVARRTAYYYSYCATYGREVRLRLLKKQPPIVRPGSVKT